MDEICSYAAKQASRRIDSRSHQIDSGQNSNGYPGSRSVKTGPLEDDLHVSQFAQPPWLAARSRAATVLHLYIWFWRPVLEKVFEFFFGGDDFFFGRRPQLNGRIGNAAVRQYPLVVFS